MYEVFINCFNLFYNIYAKQKQLVAVKKGAAKQSRINAITEFDW